MRWFIRVNMHFSICVKFVRDRRRCTFYWTDARVFYALKHAPIRHCSARPASRVSFNICGASRERAWGDSCHSGLRGGDRVISAINGRHSCPPWLLSVRQFSEFFTSRTRRRVTKVERICGWSRSCCITYDRRRSCFRRIVRECRINLRTIASLCRFIARV